jgi:tRNA pseudouridine55 synthase
MVRDSPAERSPVDLLAFGVVNLDKPPGPTSHQIADWVKRLVREHAGEGVLDRVAHTGTLDPKVTGSLPMLLGDATRMAQVFDTSIKEYVAVLELQGPAPSDFEAVVAEFEGEILQKPPRKSAVKRELRTRKIHALEVLEQEQRRALLRVRCDAGTYIRKLCHDIGLALGTGAHMGDLRRTATGHFDDTDLVTMEEFVDALVYWAEDGDEDPLREIVRPGEYALASLPRVVIAASAAAEVANGAPVYAPGVLETRPAEVGGAPAERGDLVACVTPDDAAVCLGTLVGDPAAESGVVVELERVLV